MMVIDPQAATDSLDAQPRTDIKATLSSLVSDDTTGSESCQPIRFHAATIAASFPHQVEQRLTWATWNGREATKRIVSKETAIAMLDALESMLKHEPTLAEVRSRSPPCTVHKPPQVSPDPGSKVTVVGDTHGHYHDVCNMCVASSLAKPLHHL